MSKGKTKTAKKATIKKKKFTANELKALELVAEYPEMSNHQISNKLIDLGLVRDNKYLQTRVARCREVRDKIAHLQEKGQLKFTKLLPKAAKGLQTYLKADKPPLKAIDIAAKYGLGRQDDPPIRVDTINIENLQILQAKQLETCNSRLTEPGEDDKA